MMLSDEIDSLGLLKPLQAYNYELLASNVRSYHAQYSAQ